MGVTVDQSWDQPTSPEIEFDDGRPRQFGAVLADREYPATAHQQVSLTDVLGSEDSGICEEC